MSAGKWDVGIAALVPSRDCLSQYSLPSDDFNSKQMLKKNNNNNNQQSGIISDTSPLFGSPSLWEGSEYTYYSEISARRGSLPHLR